MNILKKIIVFLLGNKRTPDCKLDNYDRLDQRSLTQLYSIIRHESHRIEKAAYNQIIGDKKTMLEAKINHIRNIMELIKLKDPEYQSNSVFNWSLDIINSFPDVYNSFTLQKCTKLVDRISIDSDKCAELLKSRRSCRVWDDNFDISFILNKINKFIEVAISAPNSGNRQAIRIKPLCTIEEKKLLIGVKEKHCYEAPLVFFIGIETSLYGALSQTEECMFLDASAAITQMIVYAESLGLGTCWNHFGLDMIYSRDSNIPIYENFINKLNIPSTVRPIAILAVGKPLFIPPKPERMPISSFIL